MLNRDTVYTATHKWNSLGLPRLLWGQDIFFFNVLQEESAIIKSSYFFLPFLSRKPTRPGWKDQKWETKYQGNLTRLITWLASCVLKSWNHATAWRNIWLTTYMYTCLMEGNTTDYKGRIIYTSAKIAFKSLNKRWEEERNNRGGATERKTESKTTRISPTS